MYFKLLFCSYSGFLCCCSRTKKDADRVPSLFEIILDPEGELQEEEKEPTLFDIVLRPEKFISQSAEEREAEEEDDEPEKRLPNPSDFNQFRYEFTTSSTTTTTQPRCLKRGHAKPISKFSIPPYHPLLLHCKNHWGRTF